MDWRWRSWEELGRDELYALVVLRQRVFVVEQRCAYLDADGRDPGAVHLTGWQGGRLVAYLRAFAPGDDGAARIGRVVTAPEVRGSGLGRPLMREGIAGALARWGPAPIALSAQAHLAAFYGSLGFDVTGEPYDEDGIPHVAMIRTGG